MGKVRYYWVDWMKVLGMFLIVWGHFFPKSFCDAIYSFNVPLFFCISGYLGGIKSLKLKPLVIPYLVICATYLILDIPWQYKEGNLNIENYLRSIGYMLAGFQTTPRGVSASALWFVYTLALCKVIHSISKRDIYRLLIALLCLALAYLTKDIHLFWSYQNVFVCYPFYFIGALAFAHCQSHIHRICSFAQNKRLQSISLICVTLLVLLLIAPYNGFVMMYQCGFRHNILLFLLLSMIGIGVIFLLSVILEKQRPSFLRIISQGSIVILAYHYLGVRIFNTICSRVNENIMNNDILTLFITLILMVMFIPIIKCVSRYVPTILGGRKI